MAKFFSSKIHFSTQFYTESEVNHKILCKNFSANFFQYTIGFYMIQPLNPFILCLHDLNFSSRQAHYFVYTNYLKIINSVGSSLNMFGLESGFSRIGRFEVWFLRSRLMFEVRFWPNFHKYCCKMRHFLRFWRFEFRF